MRTASLGLFPADSHGRREETIHAVDQSDIRCSHSAYFYEVNSFKIYVLCGG